LIEIDCTEIPGRLITITIASVPNFVIIISLPTPKSMKVENSRELIPIKTGGLDQTICKQIGVVELMSL
jgi:hypothetical protein